MLSEFSFQTPGNTIVVTGTMEWIIKRMLAVHHQGGFCVWTGRAGIGKTTTAEYAVEGFEEKYEPDDPNAFRAIHYDVSNATEGVSNPQKAAIRSLYVGLGSRIDEGFYRRSLPEELAAEIVENFKRLNVQVVFIDEAGGLSVEALRAFVLVSNTARRMKWRLTIVFIGMDNLPLRLKKNNQVSRRIYDWCYFKPYTFEETRKLLAALYPYFAQLDPAITQHREQLEFIHSNYQGMPGLIVPFVGRFAQIRSEFDDTDPMVSIQAAHVQPLFEQERSIEESKANYRGEFKAFNEQEAREQETKEEPLQVNHSDQVTMNMKD